MTNELPNSAAGVADVYMALFDALPGNSLLLQIDAPKYTILAATAGYLKDTGTNKKDLIGQGIFEAFPSHPHDDANTGEKDLYASLAMVLQLKKQQLLPARRYNLKNEDGSFTEHYWRVENSPVLTPNGEVAYIIHAAEDITLSVMATKRAEGIKGIKKAYDLFMNAPVIIGILQGDDYIIELANEGLLEVWDRTADVIGKPLLTAIPELKEQGFITLLDQVQTTGEPFYAYEFPITLNRQGKNEVVYFDFVYKPIYQNETGNKASGIISVGHNVTAQVKARAEVRENETKYQALFESMDQAFCIIEMIFDESGRPVDFRYLETNPAFEKQSGLKGATGKKVLDLIPDFETHWLLVYGDVIRSGESLRYVNESKALGKWFDVHAFRLGGPESRLLAVFFTDITERIRAEEAIRQSENNLRNIILQAPVAMCILKGPDHIIEIANERMMEVMGKPADALLNKPVFEALWEAREGLEAIMKQVYETGKRFTAFEMPVNLPRNGRVETAFCNFLYEPFIENGATSGVMAVVIEVTEQVLARQKIEEAVSERTGELAQANVELKRSNQNLEEFAYAASHDLKEPMRKIHLFADRLQESLMEKLSLQDKHLFDRISHAAQRMNTLIDDLLTYSHVSRIAVAEESVDLNKKVGAVLEDLELEIEEKNATVVAGALPTIKGHRRQLQQLFQNLVSNAIKYNKPGINPEIRISSRRLSNGDLLPFNTIKTKDQYYLFEVRDNGIGFEPKDAERIFNVFTRLHGNTEYKGTGVGLSIVQKVVENHHGYIWAESIPGAGSSFKILLPAG